MLHSVVHWLGWNRGDVVTAYGGYGIIWIGFRCRRCGDVSGKHMSPRYAPQSPPDDCYT